MAQFLLAGAHRPVVPGHWTINGKELHEYIHAGLEMPPDTKRQWELFEKWKLENAHLDAPKVKKPQAAATAKRRVYGMT